MLRVEGLHAHYGRAHILFDLSFEAAAGEVLVLLGRNGAGKSTTLKAVMGLVPPTAGRVLFEGRDIAGREPFEIARLGLGYVPEERRIFTELTVMENLEVGRRPVRVGGARRPWTPERLFELFPNLAELRRRPAGRMSGGEQQMLTVARALMGNPDLLLLDEPSEGLAPLIVQSIADLIRTLRDMGVTILLAEQNMHFCLNIATHATIVDKGQIVYRGTIAELRDNTEVTTRYLAV